MTCVYGETSHFCQYRFLSFAGQFQRKANDFFLRILIGILFFRIELTVGKCAVPLFTYEIY